ncbi:intron Large complex component GCFC2 isoform X2 [Pleurodeles waltl]|uniref:intron Large complex component GCFC2 isoform X2 n=1 Tax=Pleurodeles waltl TaxID=8319 RepID=UPI003709B5A0
MFKKGARNFRARKAESSSGGSSSSSSEDEPGAPASSADAERQAASGRSGAPRGRGLSCSSRPRAQNDWPGRRLQRTEPPLEAELGASGGKSPRVTGRDSEPVEQRKSLLSFGAQTEGDGEQFKLKKPAVSEVLFNVKKKVASVSPEWQNERTKEMSPFAEAANCNSEDVSKVEDDGQSSGSEDSQSSGSTSRSSSSQSSSSQSSSSHSASSKEMQNHAADVIPGAQCILEARRKRQLARAHGEYIALDTSSGNPKVRNDVDSDGELDDHEQRILFAPKPKTVKQRIAEKLESKTIEGSEDSEDENERQDKWEEQQIRKAVRLPQCPDAGYMSPGRGYPVKTKRKPPVPRPSVNLEDLKRQLNARLNSFQEVHRSHQREYEKITHDVETSKNTVQKLEAGANAALQYKFYKTMKTYAENLVDCLNEKILRINELEAAIHLLLHEKAKVLRERRQEDLHNESDSLQRLGISATSDAPADDNEKARHQLAECMSRRDARKQAREMLGKNDHHDGMSSDDELPPQKLVAFQENKDTVLKECKRLFEDVHEDFCDIQNILLKFQEWREKFPDSYYDAYISLCLPKILNPLIRIQLITWNPLEDGVDLDQLPWYQSIKEFNSAKKEAEPKDDDGADHSDDDIIPKIIEKTVIPKVSDFVEHVWDPLSSSQTDRLVKHCKSILVDCEPNTAKLELLTLVVKRINRTISDDVYIPLYSKSSVEDIKSPRALFQERQFWIAVKLLRNILQWDGLVEEHTLRELGLDKLLNRYLILMLLNAPPGPHSLEKCSQIVSYLPEGWFKGLNSRSTIPQLANMSKHLLQFGHLMHKNDYRDETGEVVLLLVKINALDSADVLIKEYGLDNLKAAMEK